VVVLGLREKHAIFAAVIYIGSTVFSVGTPVSSTNKIDHHDILVTEILLKMALNTIALIT
jgi:hypothetical protein